MIALACDHTGIEMKQEIMKLLDSMGLEWKDFGVNETASCDYPIYGYRAAKAVADGECDRGILICGTGIGMCMAANKIRGVRCALCSDCFSAEMTRVHNDANVLALGARVLGVELAKRIVDTYLASSFEKGGRHQRRVDMMTELEDRF